MRKLRVANISYAACRPYRMLAELDFVKYFECEPAESRRRLHEREVDIALIPATEYAIHGGYEGLDFGFGCHERSSLRLCANDDIRHLTTICIDEQACTSASLLQLLLQERWHSAARLIRMNAAELPEILRPGEGVLRRGGGAGGASESLTLFEYDLVTEWHRLTGLPFVLLIWAMRPGVLSLRQLRAFNEVFHRAAAVRQLLGTEPRARPADSAGAYAQFVAARHFFYIDESGAEGVREFFRRTHGRNLLPRTEYRTPTFTIMRMQPTRRSRVRSVDLLLQAAVEGRRLSIREGIRLARRASLADLGLAADLVRVQRFPERRLTRVVTPPAEDLLAPGSLSSRLSRLLEDNPEVLRLPPLLIGDSLRFWESLLVRLRIELALPIEGLSVGEVLRLAWGEGLEPARVLARLKAAGLSSLSGAGGGLLVDRRSRETARASTCSAAAWIATMRGAHRLGITSSCSLAVSGAESWEDRILHLHKLRALQDERQGFHSFSVESAGAESEVRLRALLTGSLFLDNIPATQEAGADLKGVLGALDLSFGATRVRLEVGPESARVGQSADVAMLLEQVGLPLVQSPSALPGELIH